MTWQLAGVLAGGLIAAGLALLAVAIRATQRRHMAPDQAAGIRARQARQDVQEAMDELAALAGRIDQRVEDRLAELARTLAEADAKIALVRSLLAETAAPSQPDEPAAESPAGDFVSDDAPNPINGDDAPEAPLDPRQADIRRLSRQGLSPVEIARRLEMNVGEVELVLNLLLARERLN